MVLEEFPVLFLPHSLHPIPTQPARPGGLQHTMAELKACNRKFVGSLIRFCLLVSEKEIQSSALKAGGEELADTAVFYTELLKVVAAWWQAGDSLHTCRALVCSGTVLTTLPNFHPALEIHCVSELTGTCFSHKV